MELCPRGELFPLAMGQRQDSGTATDVDTVFVAASTRDPWANTMEGRGMSFSPQDQGSGDEMSEGSSECPRNYIEDHSGTAGFHRKR